MNRKRTKLLTLTLIGWMMTASAQQIVSENVFKDITTQATVRNTRFARPSPAGKLRKTGKPVVFYIGDSTMRTLTDGNGWNGQWGFGLFAQEWFDENELVVENHALGGTSSVTYYENEWAKVKKGIKTGDYVVISFGHNDKDVNAFANHLRKYIDEVRALGATPILCSRTPRCGSDGKLGMDTKYRPSGMSVAQEKNVAYIDLEGVANPMYIAFGEWKYKQFYQDGKLHTTLLGAWHNAYCHALAIAADTENPLRAFLKDTTPQKLSIERQAGKPYTFVVGGDDTSARGTFRSGRWALVYNTLERGDSVFLTFGPNEQKSMLSSGELGCIQVVSETQEVKQMTSTQRFENVYSYGWYIHYFLNDIKEKGAIGVIINEEGKTPSTVAGWNRALARQLNVELREIVTDITLNKTTLSLLTGQIETLTATVMPDNATNKSVIWSSSDDKVVTVSNTGMLTAKAPGTATITCQANNGSGVQATCEVTVTEPKPTAITLQAEATVIKGETLTLVAELTPSNAKATLTWSSDDETIAKVDANGMVTGIKKGQTFINVETDNGKTAYCKLTVTTSEPTAITLPKNATVYVGEGLTLTPTLTPEGSETTLTWTSDDEAVVRVSADGVLTGVAEGLAIVTVSTSNSLTANVKVKVEPNPTGVTDIQAGNNGTAPVYTLSGQRLAKPRKGLNIVGGKKIIVK